MKIIKIAGAVIGLLIAVFFLLGVFFPRFEYDSSVVIEAPPETCWDVFHDPSGMNKWMPESKSLTLKSGEPLQKGAVYALEMEDNGETMTMEEIITDVEPGKSIGYELTNEVLTSVYTVDFVQVNDNETRIQSHYKVSGNNPLWGSMLFLSKSLIRGSTQQQLEGVKKIAEAKR